MTTARADRSPAPPLTVRFGAGEIRRFTTAFRIGRSEECELCIVNNYVSRVHAQVVPEGSAWFIRDLDSANGIYRDGFRVKNSAIEGNTTVRLGAEGPELAFELQPASPPPPAEAGAGEETMVARYAERYFGRGATAEPAGEHTMFVRRAFAQVQTRQKRKYNGVFILLLAVAAGLSIYALHLRREAAVHRELALSLFYQMKSLDVEIATLQAAVSQSHDARAAEVLSAYEARRKKEEQKYDDFLVQVHIKKPGMTEQQRIIARIARVFGECDIDMPPDFEQEIERYIQQWQHSGRYAHDIRLAQEKGYTRSIPQELMAHGLPPQFFYLAMQESDFDPYVSGPMTRMGIAKGMWQFIPKTAVHYGLHLGPLADVPRADPSDERDQFSKATRAAAEYLQTLYSTDAQASGLLVMACYNWGEFQVLPLVRSLPPDPRERNFWRLLTRHRDQIPQQTYDYVFYITSAAVIGENPRLFGFDFDNPLEEPDDKKAATRYSVPTRASAMADLPRSSTGAGL